MTYVCALIKVIQDLLDLLEMPDAENGMVTSCMTVDNMQL